jgi:hypothetical protein
MAITCSLARRKAASSKASGPAARARKGPSAEALEVGRRVNQLPRAEQIRLATIAAAATADAASNALPVQGLINRLFEIGCRVAVYAHVAEHLDNDEAPHARKEAAGALPVALSEIHRDLLDIVNGLQDPTEAAKNAAGAGAPL